MEISSICSKELKTGSKTLTMAKWKQTANNFRREGNCLQGQQRLNEGLNGNICHMQQRTRERKDTS